MNTVAIIGGKLQGVEAAYLARKAGIRSILIDKNENALARNLCDEFLCDDVLKQGPSLLHALESADFILPALENEQVLSVIVELASRHGLTLAFDPGAYQVSSSKLLSDLLIHDNQVPAPAYFPDCNPPYIAKPSSQSGSVGVQRIETRQEMESFLKDVPKEESWVAQEFLAGPSYSIEVIGTPGHYRTYAITEIHMDEVYDCRKVTAPCPVTESQILSFQEIAINLAGLVNLLGIMDVEVIDDKGQLKVLEIDARIPSQTPIVVYHASGVNLLAELRDLFCSKDFQEDDGTSQFTGDPQKQNKYVSLEHLLIQSGKVSEHGEHIMAEGNPLTLRTDFFGADEVLSDYCDGSDNWRGTFINAANSLVDLEQKRIHMRRLLSASK